MQERFFAKKLALSILGLLLLAGQPGYAHNTQFESDDWAEYPPSRSPEKQSISWSLGDYLIAFLPANGQLRVTDQRLSADLSQPVLQTSTGSDWLQGQFNPLNIKEQRGSYQIKSQTIQNCQAMRVDQVLKRPESFVIKGAWREPNCEQSWQMTFKNTAEGHLHWEIELTQGRLNQIALRLQKDVSEHWFGGGEQFTHTRLNDQLLPSWVQENGIGRGAQPLSTLVSLFSPGSAGHAQSSYISVPWLFSQSGRGFVLENSEYSEWDLRQSDSLELHVWSPKIKLRIVSENSPLKLLQSYTAWSGRMPVPPDWADQGAWVGMQGGSSKVKALWQQLKALKTPVAAFWLQDWVGKRKTQIGSQLWWNWELNQSQYPAWPELVAELNENQVRVLGYINPFLVETAGQQTQAKRNLYSEARQKGFLVKDAQGEVLQVKNTDFSAGMLDLSHLKAREWFKQVIKEQVISQGLSGWMADYGEALPVDAALNSAESALSYHNRYPEEWARLQREIIAENPAAELLVFLRSGFTRSPRWAQLFWLGDQSVSWDEYDGLRSAVRGLLSGGLSGFALNHSDAGGYTSVCSLGLGLCRSPELLQRWLEVNAWTSFLRTHEGNQPEQQAQFYSSPELLKSFDRQARIYTAWRFLRRELFVSAAREGLPVVRHLILHFPDDANVPMIQDQFMLGPDLMVAPVLEPGAVTRRLYLPAGPWVELWSGRSRGFYTHGGWVTVPAPLGQAPVFYRQGSKLGPALRAQLKALGIF
jgi:sulfoquinovosidase